MSNKPKNPFDFSAVDFNSDTYMDHPLETEFDIEPSTTIAIREEHVKKDLSRHKEYDDKDVEIEEQLQEVYDSAMQAYTEQMNNAATVEGKFSARNSEVASQFLSTALSAIKEKIGQKTKISDTIIKKANAVQGLDEDGKPTKNDNIIMDRKELMKMLRENEPKVVNPSVTRPTKPADDVEDATIVDSDQSD